MQQLRETTTNNAPDSELRFKGDKAGEAAAAKGKQLTQKLDALLAQPPERRIEYICECGDPGCNIGPMIQRERT